MSKHHHKGTTETHSVSTGPTIGPTIANQTAFASSNKDHDAKLVSTEAIRLCAYRKWESAGKPTGDGIQFWLEAEQELMKGK